MKKLWLVIGVLLSVFFLGCSEIKDWSDPADNIPPGEITDIRVKNTNGGAVIHYRLPSDNDLLGAKAVFTFSENEEPIEVYASAFQDSIVLEGYANTEEHIVQLYAVDKSGNLSQPVPVTIQPLTPPVEQIRKTLATQATFSGVRTTWENPSKSPISISLYTTDSTGEKVLFEQHYSSAEQGGYTFRQFDAVEQAFSVEVNDRWNHTSSRLDTVLTPLFETQILGKVNNVNRWNPYDYTNAVYRGDPI